MTAGVPDMDVMPPSAIALSYRERLLGFIAPRVDIGELASSGSWSPPLCMQRLAALAR